MKHLSQNEIDKLVLSIRVIIELDELESNEFIEETKRNFLSGKISNDEVIEIIDKYKQMKGDI